MTASAELKLQWQNPKDILSLLLLIGGDVVQRAIAQMFGVYFKPFTACPRIYFTPVAFSFGWVGYAFTSLVAVVGDKQLMPAEADGRSIVVNCDNGYTRANRSWVLGRIIRDHEIKVEKQPGAEAAKLLDDTNKAAVGLSAADPPIPISMRIDIFDLEDNPTDPTIDTVWILGCLTIVTQLVVSTIPWIKYDDWSILFITGAGTLFALLTGMLRQWNLEKWPGRRLNKADPKPLNGKKKDGKPGKSSPAAITAGGGCSGIDVEKGRAESENESKNHHSGKDEQLPYSDRTDVPEAYRAAKAAKKKVVCLTRGNGHKYMMILLGSKNARNIESLATATSKTLPETKYCLCALAFLWILLLISVSGIESNTWFLILIGGMGMLQNIYAASAPRTPESLGLRMTPYVTRSTIIGAHVDDETKLWAPGATETADDTGVVANDPLVGQWLEPWATVGVRGALRELEKTIPKAGMALMPECFPRLWTLDSERYRDKREERFWRWMYKRPKMEDRN